jgi:hypothetical protein
LAANQPVSGKQCLERDVLWWMTVLQGLSAIVGSGVGTDASDGRLLAGVLPTARNCGVPLKNDIQKACGV